MQINLIRIRRLTSSPAFPLSTNFMKMHKNESTKRATKAEEIAFRISQCSLIVSHFPLCSIGSHCHNNVVLIIFQHSNAIIEKKQRLSWWLFQPGSKSMEWLCCSYQLHWHCKCDDSAIRIPIYTLRTLCCFHFHSISQCR